MYSHSAGKLTLELRGENLDPGKYVAVGLSDDAQMGGDVVFSCSNGGSAGGIAVSFNQGKSNRPNVQGVEITGELMECQSPIGQIFELANFCAGPGGQNGRFRAADIEVKVLLIDNILTSSRRSQSA